MEDISIEVLLKEEVRLKRKLEAIRAMISAYGTEHTEQEKAPPRNTEKVVYSSSEYPKGGTWNQRIKYVLGKAEQSLTAKEITERMKELEPEKEIKLIASQVTQNTSAMAKSGNEGVVSEKDGSKNRYSLK